VLIVLAVVFKARSDDEDKESGDTAMGGEGASYFADDGEFDSAVAQPEDNGVYAAAPTMDIDDASAAINYGSLTNVVAESTSPITYDSTLAASGAVEYDSSMQVTDAGPDVIYEQFKD